MSKSKKKFPGNAYCVFQDVQRHTCVRVHADAEGVLFIPMATTLDLCFLSNKEFEQTYIIELTDYPVKKAAVSYLAATWLVVTDAARRHLEHLSGVRFTETAKPLNFENKESIMTAEAQTEAAAAKSKKVAAPKTTPAKTPAPKKGAAAPEAKASKKVAAPAKEAAATRTSKEAGMKIKVLDKNPAVREGSNREKHFKAVLSSKTTDEAAEKLREFTNKPWDVIRVAVQQGIIELV